MVSNEIQRGINSINTLLGYQQFFTIQKSDETGMESDSFFIANTL
jgi:hypothetical protein